jgi:hypothetical protein
VQSGRPSTSAKRLASGESSGDKQSKCVSARLRCKPPPSTSAKNCPERMSLKLQVQSTQRIVGAKCRAKCLHSCQSHAAAIVHVELAQRSIRIAQRLGNGKQTSTANAGIRAHVEHVQRRVGAQRMCQRDYIVDGGADVTETQFAQRYRWRASERLGKCFECLDAVSICAAATLIVVVADFLRQFVGGLNIPPVGPVVRQSSPSSSILDNSWLRSNSLSKLTLSPKQAKNAINSSSFNNDDMIFSIGLSL